MISIGKLIEEAEVDWGRKLIEASEKGDLAGISEALAHDVDIHVQDDCALKQAAQYGHLEAVRLLWENGANPRADCSFALRYAAEGGYLDIVAFLLEHDHFPKEDMDWVFRAAIKGGHMDVALLLQENGADLHADDDLALGWAGHFGHLPMVIWLLSQGADIRGNEDYALVHAAKRDSGKHLETVAYLVGWAGPETGELYREHHERFEAQAKAVTALPADARRAALIDAEGEPTLELTCLTAAGLLAELFDLRHWQGETARAHGKMLYHEIRKALPERYRERINAVDMSAFRPQTQLSCGFAAKVKAPSLLPNE